MVLLPHVLCWCKHQLLDVQILIEAWLIKALSAAACHSLFSVGLSVRFYSPLSLSGSLCSHDLWLMAGCKYFSSSPASVTESSYRQRDLHNIFTSSSGLRQEYLWWTPRIQLHTERDIRANWPPCECVCVRSRWAHVRQNQVYNHLTPFLFLFLTYMFIYTAPLLHSGLH